MEFAARVIRRILITTIRRRAQRMVFLYSSLGLPKGPFLAGMLFE